MIFNEQLLNGETAIVNFVNQILTDAFYQKASDIHFEPYEKKLRIRLRIDGILSELLTLSSDFVGRITTRIKVMAQLDISEKRLPQDGRFKIQLAENQTLDFRVSTCPTLFGEKIVIRILSTTHIQLDIDALGFEPPQKALFLDAIHRPQGMILVTGPTGSGKTISLYSALHILNVPEVNVSTAEDPIEIQIPGINQVNIQPKVGLTFSKTLKTFLRQDPDIIMLGEIRDLETAEIAIKAAQTGHMVLSTLHTKSAKETLTRLLYMGIPAFNLVSSITLIIAQRLIRLLCEYCKKPSKIPLHTLLDIGFSEIEATHTLFYEPQSCTRCHQGYKGRIGIYELLPMTQNIAKAIVNNQNHLPIIEYMKKMGLNTLRRSGLNKAKCGLTSLAEVNRVIED